MPRPLYGRMGAIGHPMGVIIAVGMVGGGPTPPDGFGFVVDESGHYVVDGDGHYVIVPAAPMGFVLVRQSTIIVTHLGHPVYVPQE